jgi:hypothetical protein
MRRLGLISSLVIASLVTVSACTLESTPDPETAGDVSAPGNTGAEDTTARESPDSASSDSVVVPLTSGCSHVLFCDNPSSSIGSDCRQDGCSLASAESECLSDITSPPVSCALHFPIVIRNSGTTILAKALSCGGHRCAFGNPDLVYCGPTGACCDGIHFNSACPPL